MDIEFTKWGETYSLRVSMGQYYGMKTASGVRCPVIQLYDNEDEQPFMTASVNIPTYPLEEGEVIIKNYSENEGILDALIEAGVVAPPHAVAYSGYVEADVCRLLEVA